VPPSDLTDADEPPPAGLPLPARYWAIVTIALGLIMAVLDSSIANVALPTIARDLDATPAASIWVVNAYQLAVTISLLPLASMGDIWGYRRVYRGGLLVFTIASLACALSGSLTALAAARVLQGFGAAGIMSVNTALIRMIYPRRMLGTAMGINATMVAISSAVGPTVASAILSFGAWPSLFYVNVPIGIVALVLSQRTLPFSLRAPHRFDWGSAALNALTFGLLITGIDGLGHGESAAAVAAELVGAGVFGVLLVRRQLRRPAPLLPVDLMRIPIFALSICTSVASFCAAMMALVALPFYMQGALGRTQVATGFLMTAWPATVALVATGAGRLSERIAPGLLCAVGLCVLAAGLFSLTELPANPSSFAIIWRMAVCGLGFGVFQTPNNRAMLGAAPMNRSGGASGMLSTARLLGQTSGAALVSVLFSAIPGSGTQASLLAGMAFALAGAVLSLLRLGR
jgi:DHA2 family multidrug resistance protein-like MFS transporter